MLLMRLHIHHLIRSLTYLINLPFVVLLAIGMHELFVVKIDEFHLRYNLLVIVFHLK